MAKRRMLSIEICTSDSFLELTEEARQLYFYINLYADDDGFVGNTTAVTKMIGIAKRFLDELCQNEYLIGFPGGVYAVRHWCIHNQLRKDRYTPTQYVKEARMLKIVDRIYVFKDENDSDETPLFGNRLATQISSDERSEDELKEEEKRENTNNSIEDDIDGEDFYSDEEVFDTNVGKIFSNFVDKKFINNKYSNIPNKIKTLKY